MTTDAVYVLGNGSLLDNAEIRFSLRSLEANASGLGRVFVVGEKPEFLNWSERLIHVPFIERHAAYRNVWEKLQHIASREDLSETFAFMNDDFYIIKKFDAGAIPMYARGGSLRNVRTGGKTLKDAQMADISKSYHRVLKNTLTALQARGLTTHLFSTHQPVNFEKTKVLATYAEFERELKLPYGLSFRCCYGNLHGFTPVIKPTYIVRNTWTVPSGRLAFASHRDVDKNMLVRKLSAMFPKRSSFERNL